MIKKIYNVIYKFSRASIWPDQWIFDICERILKSSEILSSLAKVLRSTLLLYSPCQNTTTKSKLAQRNQIGCEPRRSQGIY